MQDEAKQREGKEKEVVVWIIIMNRLGKQQLGGSYRP